jgi:hypothetical protein
MTPFTSTSKNMNVAIHDFRGGGPYGVILEITMGDNTHNPEFDKVRPKCLHKISYFPSEDEYLFNCFSSFEIIKYREEGDNLVLEMKFSPFI